MSPTYAHSNFHHEENEGIFKYRLLSSVSPSLTHVACRSKNHQYHQYTDGGGEGEGGGTEDVGGDLKGIVVGREQGRTHSSSRSGSRRSSNRNSSSSSSDSRRRRMKRAWFDSYWWGTLLLTLVMGAMPALAKGE